METSIECGLVGGIGGNIDIQLNTHAKYAGFILVSYDLVLISIKYSDLCHICIVIVLQVFILSPWPLLIRLIDVFLVVVNCIMKAIS